MGLRYEYRGPKQFTPEQIAAKQQAQIDKLNKMLMDNSEKQNKLEPNLKKRVHEYDVNPSPESFSLLWSIVTQKGTLVDEGTILEKLLEDEKNA